MPITLDELQLEMAVCQRCLLGQKNLKVFARGNPKSKVLILGQNPGTEELKQGQPFVGNAGKVLEHKLQLLDLTDKVYVTNSVLCYTPDNREPTNQEIKNCQYFLWEQIKAVNPRLIIVLGGVALNALTGKLGIMKYVGEVITHNGYKIIPVPHPASILHNKRQEEFWDKGWDQVAAYILTHNINTEIKEGASSATDFVHLHLHTEHSTLDAIGRIESIVSRAQELGFKAMAITDHGTLSGWYSFHKACRQAKIKPILGVEGYITFDHEIKGTRQNRHIILLAKNLIGYKNLIQLMYHAHKDGFYYKPRFDLKLLKQYSEGIIASTACFNSVLFLNEELAKVKGISDIKMHNIYQLREIFGKDDLYLEVMPHNMKEQIDLNTALMEHAQNMGLKIIMTNDCHYIRKGDEEAHKVITSMAKKEYLLQGLYMRTWSEMEESWQQIHPGTDTQMFLDNIKELVSRIEDYDIPKGKNILPDPAIATTDRDFTKLFDEIVLSEFLNKFKADPLPGYEERLKYEMDIIKKFKFEKYFLIIYEYLDWCRQKNIIYQLRGSVGGSLVAYVMGMVDLDPIKYELMFERFISPVRNDLPDIDVDVEDVRREEVIHHLEEVYGVECVAHLGILTRLKGKACLRELGRYLKIPFQEVSKVVDVVDKASKGDLRVFNTIEDTWDKPEFASFRSGYPQVLPLAMRLEGNIKTKSTHAAAVVITPNPLVEYVPMEHAGARVLEEGQDFEDEDPEAETIDTLVPAYSPEEIEELGMVKLDILGSNTLRVLKETEKLTGPIDWNKIGYNDAKSFAMYSAGFTVGIHQFDGQSITDLTKRIKVRNFYDLCVINALHRPGPLESGVANEYAEIREGMAQPKTIHPVWDEVCRKTNGLIVFQEQLLKILREIGGFNWEDVNKVRKLVAKSKGEEAVNAYRIPFGNGAQQRGISLAMADDIFSQIVKYGKYSFNLAHSALYSAESFKCMYLKTHYPAQFMAALLAHTKKKRIFEYISEAHRLGIPVSCPDINQSAETFTAANDKILAGLCQIKGVGASLAERIISNRPYNSLREFVMKVQISKDALMNLIRSGCFDSLYYSRKAIFDYVKARFDDFKEKVDEKQNTLMAVGVSDNTEDQLFTVLEDWDPVMRYNAQLEILELPAQEPILTEEFYSRFPTSLILALMPIAKILKTEITTAKTIGWVKTSAKLKNNVRIVRIVDDYGRSIEATVFKNDWAEVLPDYTLAVCHLRANHYKGRSGYVLEGMEKVVGIGIE